jgi:hypothetical protein
LLGFLFAQHYKTRFLRKSPRLSVIFPDEQRRMIRVKRDSIFELGDASGRLDAAAKLVNMSLGGISFKSPLQLKNGERVQAKLSDSKDWLLHISGRVVWMKPAVHTTGDPESHATLYGLEIQNVSENRR